MPFASQCDFACLTTTKAINVIRNYMKKKIDIFIDRITNDVT